uniref:Uncharacterized protein n=1 Tax=Oryza brachyantha TaxID=4533 RepID=J3N4M5_ORYBR
MQATQQRCFVLGTMTRPSNKPQLPYLVRLLFMCKRSPKIHHPTHVHSGPIHP